MELWRGGIETRLVLAECKNSDIKHTFSFIHYCTEDLENINYIIQTLKEKFEKSTELQLFPVKRNIDDWGWDKNVEDADGLLISKWEINDNQPKDGGTDYHKVEEHFIPFNRAEWNEAIANRIKANTPIPRETQKTIDELRTVSKEEVKKEAGIANDKIINKAILASIDSFFRSYIKELKSNPDHVFNAEDIDRAIGYLSTQKELLKKN